MRDDIERFCRDLLNDTYPDMDERWLDEQTARAVRVVVEATADAERAADRDRQEIRQAVRECLYLLRGRGLSPEAADAAVTVREVTMTVTARPSQTRYTIDVHVTSARQSIDELAGLGLTVSTTGDDTARWPVRHLAVFDERGRASFANVRGGRWHLDMVTPTWEDGRTTFPMPAMETGALAAATEHYAVAAPNRALFTLDDLSDDDTTLEITGAVSEPRLVPLVYLDRDGAVRRLLVAIAPGRTGAARSRVELPGFDRGAAWEAGDYQDPAVLTVDDSELIRDSLYATDDTATLRAWRALATKARLEVGAVIEALLDPR
ncbi:hypothetical protein [Nonomuraea candida]|uniref:hypothetical protein n=1 Tax=Nonomuraea candida TaxID=359159 RepID=UPI000A82DA5E|nr:hypothetical protein [Nonomuraea candida]